MQKTIKEGNKKYVCVSKIILYRKDGKSDILKLQLKMETNCKLDLVYLFKSGLGGLANV